MLFPISVLWGKWDILRNNQTIWLNAIRLNICCFGFWLHVFFVFQSWCKTFLCKQHEPIDLHESRLFQPAFTFFKSSKLPEMNILCCKTNTELSWNLQYTNNSKSVHQWTRKFELHRKTEEYIRLPTPDTVSAAELVLGIKH